MEGQYLQTPKNIKHQLAEYGFDVSNHDFLFPYLAVYDTKAPLPIADVQPAAKHIKMCNELDRNPIERRLKFSTVHRLLSYSICTNVPGCDNEFFECRQDDTESDIKNLVKKIINQLIDISEKSFNAMKLEYSDVICDLDQAIAVENEYNASVGENESVKSGLKNLKQKFIK